MANIRLIAMALVGLSSKEVEALSRVLADEYGITLKREIPETMEKSFEAKGVLVDDAVKALSAMERLRQQENAKKWYVPKKIGKPCKPQFKKHQ